MFLYIKYIEFYYNIFKRLFKYIHFFPFFNKNYLIIVPSIISSFLSIKLELENKNFITLISSIFYFYHYHK